MYFACGHDCFHRGSRLGRKLMSFCFLKFSFYYGFEKLALSTYVWSPSSQLFNIFFYRRYSCWPLIFLLFAIWFWYSRHFLEFLPQLCHLIFYFRWRIFNLSKPFLLLRTCLLYSSTFVSPARHLVTSFRKCWICVFGKTLICSLGRIWFSHVLLLPVCQAMSVFMLFPKAWGSLSVHL